MTSTANTCSTPGQPRGTLNPLVIAHASGCDVFDHEGRRFLDFSSQLVNTNIGHSHPKVVKAIQEQAEKLATVAPPARRVGAGYRREEDS